MKMLKLIVLCLFWAIPFTDFSQLMENGDFEQYSPQPSSCQPCIAHAVPYQNLNGTSDMIHPLTFTPGTPRNGVGCARIAWGYHWDEYFYGRTLSLTAGSTYLVTYWIRKDAASQLDVQTGAYISANVPVPMTTNPYVQTVIPQVVTQLHSTEYMKVSFCYTPTQTGVHYIIFGSFAHNNMPDNDEYTIAFIDDISVELAGASNAVANIASTQSLFCSGSPIVLDGTASAGETEYEWNIFDVINGTEVLKYDGPRTDGTAGTVNVNTLLGSNLIPGHCYRAYLTVYNGCENTDMVDFCVFNPNITFLTNGSPLCQNSPTNLQVTGDDGWTYSWFQNGNPLQNGVGLKTITATPTTAGQVTYTVNVTTPEGCTGTGTYTFIVHPVNNVAPTMNGINGDINDYTYYVNAGNTVNFTSTIYNNAGETVTTTFPGLPSGFNVDDPVPSQNGGTVTISGQTTYSMAGTYDIVLNLTDNNACGVLTNTYTFHIIVVCKTCPICHDFENRTPTNDPLLPSYEMAECIGAGLSAPVVIGSGNNVRFQAGSLIEMGAFFDTDGGTYEAVIEPSTCIDNCYDCCTDWNGFTYDEIPNPVILDTDDDDPTNDYFQLLDSGHPWCSFNAVGYHLVIVNRNDNCMLDQEVHSEECCSFQSPSPEIPWLWHSPIWWDNIIHCGSGQGHYPGNDTYFYELTLYGCNGETVSMDGYIALNDYSGMAQHSGDGEMTAELSEQELTAQTAIQEQAALNEQLSADVSLNPNPATDKITIQGIAQGKVEVQIFDAKGHIVIGRQTLRGFDVDVSKLSAGTYYCKIYTNKAYISKKFVKQ